MKKNSWLGLLVCVAAMASSCSNDQGSADDAVEAEDDDAAGGAAGADASDPDAASTAASSTPSSSAGASSGEGGGSSGDVSSAGASGEPGSGNVSGGGSGGVAQGGAGQAGDGGSGVSGASGAGAANAGAGGTPPVVVDPAPTGDPVAVAVGYGMRRVSSTNGLDWEFLEESTPDGGDDNDLFRGLAFAAGRFVAVGGSSTSLSMVSLDGQTWEPEDRGQDAWMGGVAFLSDEFVVAGGNGLRVHSEDLGASWLDPVGYQAVHYRDVVSGGGAVVAVGHSYGEDPDVGVIAFTRDGRAWTEAVRDGDSFSRVAFGNGVFVAAGDNGRVSRSGDGAAWDDAVLGEGNGSVVFVNGEFVVSNSGGVFRSVDGVDFAPIDGASYGVEGYIAGNYLALGWPAAIYASPDMIEWTPVFEPGGSGFTRIVTGYFPE